MNHNESTGMTGQPIIESRLRAAMIDNKLRQLVLESTGWDSSMLSKVAGGQSGIMLDKLDAICRAMGLTIVEVRYMDYLAQGNEIGSKCCRARLSLGSCGAR